MNWIELNALHRLKEHGFVGVNQTLIDSYVFKYLSESLEVIDFSSKKITSLNGFATVYEKLYAGQFERYQSFLQNNELLKAQTRFEDSDIDILIRIKDGIESGDLLDLRTQIISADESLRGVSQMFFKNEKYLLNKPSLVDALKKILQIDHFSIEKDQQYIYKLECLTPRVIVLCENLDFLTKPAKPRKYGIELWYAGGKNINKLEFANTRGLPIYYSCDWDYDGLQIYQMVKSFLPEIILATPNSVPRDIVETDHHSLWKNRENPHQLSGLDGRLYSISELALIEELILSNKWIIEESNDLIIMLEKSGMIFQ